jgi:hypothetical protein
VSRLLESRCYRRPANFAIPLGLSGRAPASQRGKLAWSAEGGKRDVFYGLKAPFWPCANHFWSTPITGRSHYPLAGLKGAKLRTRAIKASVSRLPCA